MAQSKNHGQTQYYDRTWNRSNLISALLGVLNKKNYPNSWSTTKEIWEDYCNIQGAKTKDANKHSSTFIAEFLSARAENRDPDISKNNLVIFDAFYHCECNRSYPEGNGHGKRGIPDGAVWWKEPSAQEANIHPAGPPSSTIPQKGEVWGLGPQPGKGPNGDLIPHVPLGLSRPQQHWVPEQVQKGDHNNMPQDPMLLDVCVDCGKTRPRLLRWDCPTDNCGSYCYDCAYRHQILHVLDSTNHLWATHMNHTPFDYTPKENPNEDLWPPCTRTKPPFALEGYHRVAYKYFRSDTTSKLYAMQELNLQRNPHFLEIYEEPIRDQLDHDTKIEISNNIIRAHIDGMDVPTTQFPDGCPIQPDGNMNEAYAPCGRTQYLHIKTGRIFKHIQFIHGTRGTQFYYIELKDFERAASELAARRFQGTSIIGTHPRTAAALALHNRTMGYTRIKTKGKTPDGLVTDPYKGRWRCKDNNYIQLDHQASKMGIMRPDYTFLQDNHDIWDRDYDDTWWYLRMHKHDTRKHGQEQVAHRDHSSRPAYQQSGGFYTPPCYEDHPLEGHYTPGSSNHDSHYYSNHSLNPMHVEQALPPIPPNLPNFYYFNSWAMVIDACKANTKQSLDPAAAKQGILCCIFCNRTSGNIHDLWNHMYGSINNGKHPPQETLDLWWHHHLASMAGHRHMARLAPSNYSMIGFPKDQNFPDFGLHPPVQEYNHTGQSYDHTGARTASTGENRPESTATQEEPPPSFESHMNLQ